MEETEDVILDTPNEEETVETPEETPESTEETVEETPEVDVDQLQATNKKLYERAKKAEAELKTVKATAKPTSPVNVEETVLLANGMSEELLGELKAVAAVRRTTLIKAQNDPIFVAVKERFEKETKRKEADLPASRGAGTVKPKKDFMSPGLSREEHKEMVLKHLK